MPSVYSDSKVIKIIGIRKDGRPMYEDKDGKKYQLSDYNVKEYFRVNKENEPIFSKINEIESEIKKRAEEITLLKSQVIREKLADILKELKPNV